MKCPKCGYISFDHNLACPKCKKNISAEQEKLHLFDYRPAPPALLDSLTGEGGESRGGIQIGESGMDMVEHEVDISLGDLAEDGTEGTAFDEASELDISLDAEDSGGFEGMEEPVTLDDLSGLETSEADSGFDLDETGEDISLEEDMLSMDDLESISPTPETGEAEEELSLDLGDLSFEEPEPDETTRMEVDQEPEGEELTVDFDDMSLEDSGEPETLEIGDLGEQAEGAEIELDSSDLVLEDEGTDEEKDEIELDLDDLKVNETGELEIHTLGQPSQNMEESIDIGELPLEEPDLEEVTSDELDFGNEELDLDFEGIPLADELDAAAIPLGDEEVSLDFDNLDLELDLEEPDQKSS